MNKVSDIFLLIFLCLWISCSLAPKNKEKDCFFSEPIQRKDTTVRLNEVVMEVFKDEWQDSFCSIQRNEKVSFLLPEQIIEALEIALKTMQENTNSSTDGKEQAISNYLDIIELFPSSSFVPVLKKTIESDIPIFFRRKAIFVFSYVSKDTEYLFNLAQTDPDAEIRKAAGYAILNYPIYLSDEEIESWIQKISFKGIKANFLPAYTILRVRNQIKSESLLDKKLSYLLDELRVTGFEYFSTRKNAGSVFNFSGTDRYIFMQICCLVANSRSEVEKVSQNYSTSKVINRERMVAFFVEIDLPLSKEDKALFEKNFGSLAKYKKNPWIASVLESFRKN